MRTEPFDIPTLDRSLKRDYDSGVISAHDVAVRLYEAGWYFFIPDEEEALRRIGAVKTN